MVRTWDGAHLDVDRLRRQKAARGLRVAVVVPARDEQDTIGAVLAALQPLTAEGGDVGGNVGGTGGGNGLPPLVDELIVVDGASTDETRTVAAAAGARIVDQATADPDLPLGKGSALRAGVAASDADLFSFVDADVHDPHPGLVAGPLAPLLEDPTVLLCKAAYARPWTESTGRQQQVGGGRVTELTVRPMLALCWPELLGLEQPLAGEYAADGALLRSVAFECGYGVELGLVLDTLRGHGIDAIAQTRLAPRAHRHQSLEALGRMASELLLVMADRLAAEGRGLPALGSIPTTTKPATRQAAAPLRPGPLRPPRAPSHHATGDARA